jgi:hypothetical protein
VYIVPNAVSGFSRVPAEKAATPSLKFVGGWAARTTARWSSDSSWKPCPRTSHLTSRLTSRASGCLYRGTSGVVCKGDRLPDRHDPVFGQPVALEKGAGRVGAVDLEALVL